MNTNLVKSVAADVCVLAGIVSVARGVYVLWGSGAAFMFAGVALVAVGVALGWRKP